MLLPLFSRKTPSKQLLSLVISEGTVAAALWSIGEAGPKVLKTSAPVVWNSDAESSLVEASDVALEDLGSQANTTKDVLLGLPENWAQNQSIAPDKKHMLKFLTDQLNLKSVGFVITQEAIAALFRDREHTGCNALLVFVSQKNVYLLNILHGKASESVNVGRSESLVKDIIEGSARGNFSALPARILLASQDLTQEEMSTSEHELQATVWDEKLFIQVPRIDVVSSHIILEAVSVAGGKEVARALGILKEGKESGDLVKNEKEEEKNDDKSFGFAPVGGEDSGVDEPGETDQKEDTDEDSPLDFGIDETPAPKFAAQKILIIVIALLVLLDVSAALAFGGTKAVEQATVNAVIKTQPVSFDSILTIDANATQTDPESGILKASL